MGRHIELPPQEIYEKDKKKILESFNNGIPMSRMAANFSYTRSYITKIRDILIEEGLITLDEIKEALEKYLAENPNSQGLNKSRVRKQKETGKREENRIRVLEIEKKILELAQLRKYSKSQISRILGISNTFTNNCIEKLKEERKNKRRRYNKRKKSSRIR